ncbi:peptidoglycan editing factor PgeF [Aurantiacibacter gangjinensis]|uniref:Purine nucleoside phosphorylase n=1 Tax=Aurantiacibacter gangjinensis TaxID=502682 RepID=A0A0G9MLQ1_9SPHN|nr:peptidoglycan editing factor PgeF [Aurantiacibacter gangjinensis]APE27602.1 hypothetical protein BMF35_a0773 [Aurantiacibacter gangjinensis]KLE31636.1 hypothetical protein AAW01_08845 [Aurantiacibacter gangjinensis]
MAEVIRSGRLSVPHGFLDGEQSDANATALAVGEMPVAMLKQVHSPDVVRVTQAFDHGERPEADAMVTDKRGIALCIVTADCAPVLLADEIAGVIGAAHAGWRGAQGGVIANAVAAMEELGADRRRITAAIGPCIAQESYEVGEDMRAEFTPQDHTFFKSGASGKWQFDLEGFVASRLKLAGIATVDPLRLDTYANADRFHSYRRATHQNGDKTARQLSLIALPR